MHFHYFFQCFSWISECRYLMKHQHESTTSSMSYWSVRQNYQDADRAKRSTKHDFETQQTMNRCSSWSHQETWWARDQSNDNRHSRKDYHWTMKESLESKKEIAFSESILILSIYWISSFYEIFISSIYRESYLMWLVHSIQ